MYDLKIFLYKIYIESLNTCRKYINLFILRIITQVIVPNQNIVIMNFDTNLYTLFLINISIFTIIYDLQYTYDDLKLTIF